MELARSAIDAVVQLAVQGVQHLLLVVPNALPGSLHCRPPVPSLAQGVNHTMLAAQLGAPGIAVLARPPVAILLKALAT